MEVKLRDIFSTVSLWLGAFLLLSASILIESWRGVGHKGEPSAAILCSCSFAEVASLLQLVAFVFVVLDRSKDWDLWIYFHIPISVLTILSFVLAIFYVLYMADPWEIIFLVTTGLDALFSVAAVTVSWNLRASPAEPKADDIVMEDKLNSLPNIHTDVQNLQLTT